MGKTKVQKDTVQHTAPTVASKAALRRTPLLRQPVTPRMGYAPAPAPEIQRKTCACGGEIGADGECSACRERRETIQRKMIVNQPGDAYEQEADQVARAHVQRQADEPEPVRPSIMRRPTIQRQAQQPSAVPEVTPEIETTIQSARGGGQAMPPDVQRKMEDSLGADLGGVRVHQDSRADQLNRQLDARAFTTGNDIFFKQGEFNPGTSGGQELLAHELTHTVQQRGNENSLQRNGPGAPSSDEIKLVVDAILKDLKGYTSRWASARIVEQFRGKSTAMVQEILRELKARGPDNNESTQGMIDWLLGDLTAEDRRNLRQILMRLDIPEIRSIVAKEIISLLEGFTSESNSAEINALLRHYNGDSLDRLLSEMESTAKKNRSQMIEWLFGDLDRVNEEHVRQHFYNSGGPIATVYATTRTASRILALLEGYTSHADSTSILWNFRQTPQPYRFLVHEQLNALTSKSMQKKAEEALMENMDQADYDALRTIGGLTLSPYVDRRRTGRKIISTAEWAMVVLEWTTCGVIGIATGLLSVVYDVIVMVKDLVVVVWDLIWSLVYLLSGGAAGSAEWLAVKDFFKNLAHIWNKPGEALDSFWENLKLEFKTIEGPLTNCRQAELFVRKLINAVVTVILVFVGGYGAVKAAASGVKSTAELAVLIREIGFLKSMAQAGRGIGRAVRSLVKLTAEEVTRLVKALLNPVKTLQTVAQDINVIRLAIQREGIWQYMRGRTGELLDHEKKFWQQYRESWQRNITEKHKRLGQITDDADELAGGLEKNEAPDNPDSVVDEIKKNSAQLKDDVDALKQEMAGEPKEKPGQKSQSGMPSSLPNLKEPKAILPDGTEVPPSDFGGGYHGTNVPPDEVLGKGFPARGNNRSLLAHAEGSGDSAFRGTSSVISDVQAETGPAYWAGEGGYVYEIRRVPTWDVNALLEGRVRTPGGWRGNLMYGENERAIFAEVPPENIMRFGQVTADFKGRLRVERWVTREEWLANQPIPTK